MKNLEKFFIYSDMHIPFHSNNLLASSFYFLKDFKPDHVINIGDLLDFDMFSSFSKDPERLLSFEDDLEIARNYWKKVRQIAGADAKLYYCVGNHEERLQKFLFSKAPELSKISNLSLESLLNLKEHNVSIFHEWERLTFHGKFEVKHGKQVATKSGYSAHKEMDKIMMSGVTGHVHRAAKVIMSKNNIDYTWCECGHMADLSKGFKYIGSVPPDWKNAMAVAYMWQDDKDEWQTKVDLVEATNEHSFLYNNKLYTPKGVLNF